MPQNKILLRDDELKSLLDDISANKASIYGEKDMFFGILNTTMRDDQSKRQINLMASRLGASIGKNDEQVRDQFDLRNNNDESSLHSLKSPQFPVGLVLKSELLDVGSDDEMKFQSKFH